MADMQSLSFNISANASQASADLDTLVKSLENLKTASSGGTTQLRNLATSLGTLAKSVNSLSGVNTAKITELGTALRSLKGLTLSKSTVGNLNQLGTALKGIDSTSLGTLSTNLSKLATSMSSLKGTSSGLSTVMKRLAELPTLINQLKTADLTTFTKQMQQLSAAMKPLATQMATVGTGFSSMAYNIKKVTAATTAANTSTRAYAGAVSGLNVSFLGLLGKISMFALGFSVIRGIFDKAITLSNEYQENLNLFTVAMGDSAQAAQDFAEKVSDAVGIDPAEWMRNQGVFNTLLTGFGVVSDRAAVMSQNLTQLGYDLSSFFNISTADALTKIQSGISGELEPLRRLGYDLSVTRLQQEAYNLGITKSVNAMTQAEKAQLRYHAIMTQVTTAQGDMARTINAPANQLRVLKAQVTMAARAFGNIFIPILNAVLPVLIAVAKAIRIVAVTIASLFGFKLAEVDYSSVNKLGVSAGNAADANDDLNDSLGSTGKKAKKAGKAVSKYTKQLLGFDRINNLTTKDKSGRSGGSGSGGGGIGGLGGGFDIPLETYDFLAGLESYLDEKTSKIAKVADWISKHIKGVLSVLAAAIGGFVAVLAANKILAFIEAMKALWGLRWFGVLSGIFLGVAGAILAVIGAIDAIKNGLTFGNLFQTLAGVVLAATGAFVLFGSVGAGVVLILGGILAVFLGINDAIKNGFNKKNLIAIAAGLTAVGAAMVILGVASLPVTAIVMAAVAIGALALAIFKNRKKIFSAFEERFPRAAKFVKKAFNTISTVIKKLAKLWASFMLHPIKTTKKLWKGFKKWMAKHFSLKGLFSKKNFDTSKLGTSIKDAFEGAFGKIDGKKLVESFVSAWFKSLTFPLTLELNLADKALDGLESLTGIDLKATFSGWAEGAKDKWESFKSGIGDIWSSVKATFGGWISGAQSKWESLRDGIKDKIADAKMDYGGWVSGAYSKWSSLRDAIKDKTATLKVTISAGVSSLYKKVQRALASAKKKAPKVLKSYFPTLPALAKGGYLNTGQMFIAREAGPEMVGKIGNKSAVANNAQIEGALTRSIANANVSQNMLLRQLISAVNNSGRSDGGSADIKLIIDGQTFGKAAINNINKVQRQQGRTLLEV